MTRPRALGLVGLAALLALALASPVGAQVAGYIWQIAGSTVQPVRTINVSSGSFSATTGTLTISGGLGDGGVTAAAPLSGLGTAASPLSVRDGGVTNQYIATPTATINGTSCTLGASCTVTASGPPTGAASGDLSGTYPSPTVARINGATLGTTTATGGNLLIGSGSSWVTRAVTGDVALLSTGATTVGALQSRLVSNAAPVNGYVLTWNGSASQWEPQTVPATTNAAMPSTSATLAGGTPITLSNTTWTTLSTATLTPTANAYAWGTATAAWTGGTNSVIGLRMVINGTTGVAITQQTTANNDQQSTAVNAITAAPVTSGVAITVTLQGQLVSGPNITVTAAALFAFSVQGTGVTSGVSSVSGTAPITSSGGTTPAIGLALAPTGGLTSSGGSLGVSYGTTAGTSTVGNDARLNVSPAVAGGVAYDTGSAWTRTAAGTSTQVLHGGAAPSWGSVALATDVSGTLPAGNMATVGPGAGTYGALPGSGSPALVSVALDAQGRVTAATTSQLTVPPVTALQNVSVLSAGNFTLGFQFIFLTAATVTGGDFYWPTTVAARTITVKMWTDGGVLIDTCTVSVTTAGSYGCAFPATHAATAGVTYRLSFWDGGTSQDTSGLGDYGLPYSATRWGMAGPNVSIGPSYYAAGNAFPTLSPAASLRPLQPRFTIP